MLDEFETHIRSLTLVPSEGGRFELSVNGKLLYSKLHTGRHAEAGEAIALIRKYIQENKA